MTTLPSEAGSRLLLLMSHSPLPRKPYCQRKAALARARIISKGRRAIVSMPRDLPNGGVVGEPESPHRKLFVVVFTTPEGPLSETSTPRGRHGSYA